MTKIIKFFAIIYFLAILFLAGVGLMAPPETYVSQTLVIESPAAVVWRELTDVDTYAQWQTDMYQVRMKNPVSFKKGGTLRFIPKKDTSGFHEAVISQLEADKRLTLLRVGWGENVLLREYQTAYTLKQLKNSSTEITVAVSYKPISLFVKTYNQLYLRIKLREELGQNLARLKSRIEKI
ncbi:MAG: SRPBCC family protein [Calditrichales bacterium]|nr:MAG: SRPBCC family protein [Calditrichales bacterium]